MALYNRGVAQREIARRLNLSRSTVRNYIRSDGVPSDRHVKAQATPIPVRTIFGNDGSKVSTMPASLQKKSANEDSLRPITVSDVVLADWRRNVRTRSSKPQYDRTRDRQNNSVGCYSKKKKISPIESGRSNHESLTLVRMSGKLGRRQPVSSNCSGKQVGHDLAKWLDDAMGSTVRENCAISQRESNETPRQSSVQSPFHGVTAKRRVRSIASRRLSGKCTGEEVSIYYVFAF